MTSSGEIYFTLDLENWQLLPGRLKQITSYDFNHDGKDDLAGVADFGQIYYCTDLQE